MLGTNDWDKHQLIKSEDLTRDSFECFAKGAFRWGHIVFTFQDLPSGFPRFAWHLLIHSKTYRVHFIKMQVTEFFLPNQDGKHLSVSLALA